MVDLTRRNALKLLGSAAALVAVPIQGALALTRRPLHDEVKRAVARYTPTRLNAELEGVYSKVFRRQKSTMQVEQVAHVTYMDLGQLSGRKVSVTDGPFDNFAGQRWIYNFSTYEVGLAFSVVENDDPRAGIPNSDRAPSILGMAHLRQGEPTIPWRRCDLHLALKTMISHFRDMREENAADIFNKARTYDASIAGDGCPMVSTHHPVDGATWSNAFHEALTPASFLRAMQHIRTSWVDERNLKILGRGKLLVVPPNLADMAATIDFPHVVWDRLADPHAWFIVTHNDSGLPWFERYGLELEVWQDHAANTVMVKGYERRCFGCSDPRAVLGAFPNRA